MKYGKTYILLYLNEFLKRDAFCRKEFIKKYYSTLPNNLYRYRESTKENFNSLKEEYLWLTTANRFDDDLDSTIRINISKQRRQITDVFYRLAPDLAIKAMSDELRKKHININNGLFNIKSIVEMRDKYVTPRGKINYDGLRIELISKGVKNHEWQIFQSQIDKHFSVENIDKYISRSIKKVKKDLLKLRRYNHVSCLSETYKINSMWENYAGNHSGFCIGYNLKKSEKYSKLLFNLSPIYYGKRKSLNLATVLEYSFKKYCYGIKDENLERNLSIELNTQIRSKDKSYSFEREWRFVVGKENYIGNKQSFSLTSCIYMGHRISKTNRNLLIDIAIELDIDVFQEHLDTIQSEYYYSKVKT